MTPTQARDRAIRLAVSDPVAAREIALAISDPWFRCQALASAARYSAEAKVVSVADEALSAAAECNDDYKRAAVAAWPIRVLAERGHPGLALEVLNRAREIALVATPGGSRAEALLNLMQAGWTLGPSIRRQFVDDLVALHATDNYWRVGRALADSLMMLSLEDRDLAVRIAEQISDDRCRARALRGIHREAIRRPRAFFSSDP